MLIAVNGVNVKCKLLRDIKSEIVKSGDTVKLTVVTPMAPTVNPTIQIANQDTIRSSNSSTSSGDMHLMGDTMTGTMRNKIKSLTFLKSKKAPALKSSLRKK